MTTPTPETLSALDSLRDRVAELQAMREKHLQDARDHAKSRAAAEAVLVSALASGADTTKHQAAVDKHEAAKNTAERNATLLATALREAELRLDDALRSDESEALVLAVEADLAAVPGLKAETEAALEAFAEVLSRGQRLQAENEARQNRLDALPGSKKAGYRVETSPITAPFILRAAEEKACKALEAAGRRFVIVTVRIPVAL